MTTQPQRETVTSRDGTSIGYQTQGAGPPLAISPGSVNLIQNWQHTADELSGTFTCFLYDRLGHGGSGDHPEYSLAAEIADLQAMLEVAVDVARYRQLPQEKLHFLAGGHSHATVRETIQRFGELLPAAGVTTMPGLGHFAHTTDPPELARHVIDAAGLRRRGDRGPRQCS